MQLIHVAFAALFLNSLPLLGMLMAAIVSSGFSHTDSWAISFAYALSAGILEYLKLVLGTMVVPLITAYALQKLDPTVTMPREASILLTLFFLLVITGAILGALYPTFLARGLRHALDSEAQQLKFQQIPWDSAKESLTYACLVLGIRLPKG